ncbi:MAG: metal-dependent hydrolase [Euryarchaeota archaeon]|nr:metal-dependent hydrolase [Euryarchaeota archaeon]
MLLACHLFIGTLIGYILYRWKGNLLAVPMAMIASILPDIVDKPLGHLLLQGTLDNGRIFAHSLLFLGIIGIISIYLWRRNKTLGIALFAGVISHLLLDAMWSNPTTLFWPLLGSFTQESYPDYFGNAIMAELTAPSEYAFMLGIVAMIAAIWNNHLSSRLANMSNIVLKHRRFIYAIMLFVAFIQVIGAALTFMNGYDGAQNEMILAIVLVLGSLTLYKLDPGDIRTNTISIIDGVEKNERVP